MGCVSKLPKFLAAMKKVLEDERSVILTDGELRIAVNQLLKPKDRVAISTFELWKSPTPTSHSPENQSTLSEEQILEFRQLLQYARVKQKMELTGNVLDKTSKNAWGATWVLERKYDDLKIKQNTIELNHNPVIQISAGNEKHKNLIEGILNGETIDIQHEEVNDNKKLEE